MLVRLRDTFKMFLRVGLSLGRSTSNDPELDLRESGIVLVRLRDTLLDVYTSRLKLGAFYFV